MKLFETPVVEVIELQVMDVIAASCGSYNACPDDMGDY